MSLNDKIQSDLIGAMKARDTAKVDALRMLTSSIKNEKISKQKDLSDEDVRAVVKRQVKQLRDALSDYESGSRADLVDKAKEEIEILTGYLPPEMSEEELRKVVERVVALMGDVTSGDMGKVMGAVMKKVAGRADGNKVREVVQKIINPG